jgi:predicted transcriptional regulator
MHMEYNTFRFHMRKRLYMKNRGRADILAKILETIQTGANKTMIMYRTYLSFPQLNGYLAHLLESQMVRYDSITRLYYATEKGIHFLKTYQEMQQMIYPKDSELVKKTAIQMAA